jgi:O-antigen ligase
MFIDHPVNGVGANNGGIRMPEYYKGNLRLNTQWGRTFHGNLPQVLAETGGLGIAAYIAMLILILKYLHKLRRKGTQDNNTLDLIYADSITGGIIGFLASGAFLSVTYYPQLWTLYMLAIILRFNSVSAENQQENNSVSYATN